MVDAIGVSSYLSLSELLNIIFGYLILMTLKREGVTKTAIVSGRQLWKLFIKRFLERGGAGREIG